jgi:predicted PurR-regulated permease PerM
MACMAFGLSAYFSSQRSGCPKGGVDPLLPRVVAVWTEFLLLFFFFFAFLFLVFPFFLLPVFEILLQIQKAFRDLMSEFSEFTSWIPQIFHGELRGPNHSQPKKK